MSGATCAATPCATGMIAIAVCSGGQWSSCSCMPNTAAPPPPAAPMCGNNKKEGTEMCDGADMGGMTMCEQLNMGTGPLGCDTQCKFAFTQCVFNNPTVPVGGTGASMPMGGTGAGP